MNPAAPIPSAEGTPSGGIALALGAGGARGLSHIVVLEAIDDLGVRVGALAGSSMGAIVAAAYAAGLSGRDLRAHVSGLLRDRADVTARLLKARVGRFSQMFSGGLSNPVLIDGEIFLDLFWPEAVPDRFEDLGIPLTVVATDYHGRCEAVFRSGPLAPAVAGSMAIPGLVKPVECATLVLVDGGAVNPLPWQHLSGRGLPIVAVDVASGPGPGRKTVPGPMDAMLGAAQIMQNAITDRMLQLAPPDLLLRPPVESFRVLDFFKAAQIFEACAGLGDEVKRGVEQVLKVV